jgi:hypothetical protein
MLQICLKEFTKWSVFQVWRNENKNVAVTQNKNVALTQNKNVAVTQS